MLTQVNGTTIVIYTLYCMPYFFAGVSSSNGNFISYDPGSSFACFVSYSVLNPIYFQVYFQNQTQQYIGVQVEFTI